jgi:hypothetical protein
MEGGGWLWLFVAAGIFVLGAGIAYGTNLWRKRRMDSATLRAQTEATKANYREDAPEAQ